MKNLLLASATIALATTSVHAQDKNTTEPPLASVGMDKTEGCMAGPMAQFGRYIGDWNIEDETLSSDGKTWSPGKGARWHFTCLGNGVAIQDFWMPNGGGFGTNLRMYDKDKDSWDIAWSVTSRPAFTQITAKEDEAGNIVMRYVSPKPNPDRRITFFPPTKAGWNWHMDFSSDEGKTWRTVYRIKASRR